MIIKRFSAESFRNIEKCDIEFSPGVNLIHGKNAEGKTNAVEGIYIFSRGKSFRAREDRELVSFGKEGFRIEIEYEDRSGLNKLEYSLFGKERRRRKNGYKISRVTEMIGSFRTVLFFPDDLGLVKMGPDERRSFLNVAISQCYPAYLKCYSDYKTSLENRNAILKASSKGLYYDKNELEAWSLSMAEYSADIYAFRKSYIEKLEKYAKEIMKDISDGKEELSLFYKCDVEEAADREKAKAFYQKKLTENLERECIVGQSLYGPHRDDIEIMINGKPARYFASQGQQRSVVLALKLSEGEVSREICGEYPVFLFDDVLSELDEKRRRYILEGIGERQIIITSCETDMTDLFADRIIEVSGGSYVSSHR